MPTEYTLKKTLQSTFFNAKSDTVSDEKDRIDLCCRFLYKCDAQKHKEVNQTIVWPLWHCECVRSFQTCLNNLNTSLSNEFAFIHSINTKKCFSKDYPIVKCDRFEKYPDSISEIFKFVNLDEREQYFKRCIIYELDRNRRKELQIFDMPLNVYYAMTTAAGRLSKTQTKYFILILPQCLNETPRRIMQPIIFKNEVPAKEF